MIPVNLAGNITEFSKPRASGDDPGDYANTIAAIK